jgi:hypothetical protein
MSSDLVAMAVGDFECLEDTADGTRFASTVPGKKHLARIALESSQEILEYFNAYYTIKYPFGKLDMLAIPDFAASAMENTAAIFYRERALLADSATASVTTRKDIAATISHEVAHQWFGDLVTMVVDDLWLNEVCDPDGNAPDGGDPPEWNTPSTARARRRRPSTSIAPIDPPIHRANARTYRVARRHLVLQKVRCCMVEHYVGPDRSGRRQRVLEAHVRQRDVRRLLVDDRDDGGQAGRSRSRPSSISLARGRRRHRLTCTPRDGRERPPRTLHDSPGADGPT